MTPPDGSGAVPRQYSRSELTGASDADGRSRHNEQERLSGSSFIYTTGQTAIQVPLGAQLGQRASPLFYQPVS